MESSAEACSVFPWDKAIGETYKNPLEGGGGLKLWEWDSASECGANIFCLSMTKANDTHKKPTELTIDLVASTPGNSGYVSTLAEREEWRGGGSVTNRFLRSKGSGLNPSKAKASGGLCGIFCFSRRYKQDSCRITLSHRLRKDFKRYLFLL